MLKDNNQMAAQLESKEALIEELEVEIEEFTKNVSENMIKICDHEDIINQEIQSI